MARGEETLLGESSLWIVLELLRAIPMLLFFQESLRRAPSSPLVCVARATTWKEGKRPLLHVSVAARVVLFAASELGLLHVAATLLC